MITKERRIITFTVSNNLMRMRERNKMKSRIALFARNTILLGYCIIPFTLCGATKPTPSFERHFFNAGEWIKFGIEGGSLKGDTITVKIVTKYNIRKAQFEVNAQGGKIIKKINGRKTTVWADTIYIWQASINMIDDETKGSIKISGILDDDTSKAFFLKEYSFKRGLRIGKRAFPSNNNLKIIPVPDGYEPKKIKIISGHLLPLYYHIKNISRDTIDIGCLCGAKISLKENMVSEDFVAPWSDSLIDYIDYNDKSKSWLLPNEEINFWGPRLHEMITTNRPIDIKMNCEAKIFIKPTKTFKNAPEYIYIKSDDFKLLVFGPRGLFQKLESIKYWFLNKFRAKKKSETVVF
jgi:hypothetical protein